MTVYVYTGGAQVEVIAEGSVPDTTPPETMIVAGPNDSTSTSATITFAGTDNAGAVTFEGSLDDEMFHPVIPPMELVNLTVGPHTYRVRSVDAAGNVDPTPASVTWTVLPLPTSGAGTWTKYPTSFAAGNEAEYQSWYNLAYDSKRDVFYGMDWMGIVAKFSHTEQKWTKLTPNIGGGTHNRTFAYDPFNDRLWIGNGTGSTLLGVNYYDPTSNTLIPHATTGPMFGSEAAAILDPVGKRLVVFGGWQRLGVYTFALDPVATAMTWMNVPAGPAWDPPSGSGPGAAQKMTHWRSDLDTARNRIFFVDVDGSLWFLPLPALSAWQNVVPAGPVPPVHTQYVYDREHDCIVGWSAANAIAGGSTYLPPERETWVLSFATMTWEKVANAAAGDTVPGRTVYVGYAMAYDPLRQQTLLHTLAGAGNYDPSTWAYRRSL